MEAEMLELGLARLAEEVPEEAPQGLGTVGDREAFPKTIFASPQN
jgi:hypothetical protein